MNKEQLQPNSFKNFVGQNKIINVIKWMIESSEVQKKPLDHILFYSSPGTGKTTLASVIANEQNTQIHYAQGSNIEKKSDLIALLASLEEGDILFIDEIHSLNEQLQESLYSAMEYFVFDLIVGVEDNARTMRMKLKPFTLIGATTDLNLISKPFKERFGFLARFKQYEDNEIEKIIVNSAKKLKMQLDEGVSALIAEHSRKTPRIANHLLKRCNDLMFAKKLQTLSLKNVAEVFKNLEIFKFGLNREHIDFLKTLRESFNEKWVSLDTVVNIVSSSKDNILKEIEPVLLSNNLIEKSSRGRRITSHGVDYLLSNFQSIS
ncbi:Holliday junction branch migration DNA helicase RuvB [Mycoplasma sp. Ms02]|uniref:Holliday junction branch migration DNA helicase RuvB n=1 Tax=Mycoplasma sp. Ms02 TaxID=353851 RepID=UPI001C8A5A47|nr:Holliday junction branch migration DNA helicase RuvB [Mycoplasma sp. Ms02]QZE12560.1 Holliday junction branch migration DNA helicase RuvB [Mycoplasma sp. Ms02]